MWSTRFWIKVEGITLSAIRQTQKDKYYMISLIHGIYNGQTHKNTEQKDDYKGTRIGEIGECWPKGTNFHL